MTRSLKIVASAFVALLTFTAAPPTAKAQVPGVNFSRVNVPFTFEVGSRHFQPGVYNLSLINAHVLRVQGDSDAALLMTNPDSVSRPRQYGSVMFERIGTKYFLTQVYTPASSTFLQSVKTDEMKQARRIEIAALRLQPNAAPDTTTLALLK